MVRYQFIDVTATKYVVVSPLLQEDGTLLYESIYYRTDDFEDAVKVARECQGHIRHYEDELHYNCIAY